MEINGNEYTIGKMGTRVQFHVARRLAPIYAAIQGSDTDKFAGIAAALSSMPDAECDYVLDSTLAVVKRMQGTTAAPIFTRNVLMFADIDLPTMMQLAVAVIQDNLGGFFAGAAPSGSDAAT